MLDRYEHTLDEEFLKETTIPFATEILTFFVEHYGTDEDGKLVMHPAQALETWWECTNPMDPVAGMRAVTDRLLGLPEHLTTPELRKFWADVEAKIPPLPTREYEGETIFAPAEKFDMKKNGENPELYCVFPFRLVSFEKPNAEMGRRTLHHRTDSGNWGWRQGEIFMVYLGLADEARNDLVARARNKHEDSRFPAFWGPNNDWMPDQCHSGVLMKAFQSMLLQTEGEKIYLLPAWPEDWNAEFKLHAPYKTVVEGKVVDGQLVDLEVTPESRRKDVVVATEIKRPQ
jgi:alpha-L-fucosidase 2